MTEQSSNRGQPDDWGRGGYVAGEQYHGAGDQYPGAGEQHQGAGEQHQGAGGQYYGAGTADPGMAGPGNDPPTAAIPQSAPGQAVGSADSKGFLGALFDFSFTSFVTIRVIKVLYVLILILTVLSALVFTVSAFSASATFGLLTLVIGDPLFILVVMAFWRLILESFIVVFRIADDIRALRDRGESR
jgi:hypothetical protein